jgi:nucleotide-binding universal stress UspA family protein
MSCTRSTALCRSPWPDWRPCRLCRQRISDPPPRARSRRSSLRTTPAPRREWCATAPPRRRSSSIDRLILGSTAERVLHRADCPVLTVPWQAHEHGSADRFTVTDVLCAVDFSEGSLQALTCGLRLAQEQAARVTVLHVIEMPLEDPLFGEASLPLSEYLALSTARAAARLSRVVPAAARNWCEVRTLVRHGRPAVVILSEADTDNAGLIVMGSQGRHGVGLSLFGSTTQTVVRRATCPVLTTRAAGRSSIGRAVTAAAEA